jgi:hypothetical protein
MAFTGGAAALSAVIGIGLAVLGILPAFLRTTFLFLPRLAPAYALGFPALPSELTSPLFPDALTVLANGESFYYWCLLLAIIALAMTIAHRRELNERSRAALPFIVWFLAATLSVFERWHIGYALFVVPVGIVLAARAIRGDPPATSGRRFAAGLLVAWTLVMVHPLRTAQSVQSGFAYGRLPGPWVFPDTPRRARGAAFDRASADRIAAVGAFIDGNLKADETWLDFTSTSVPYFLFDRRCPVRYSEVAFYETPEAQREVIGAIETNPRVRAALVHFRAKDEAIDGVPNSVRAPLVWNYIQQNFHPAFSLGDVAFWMRNEKRVNPIQAN